MHENVTKFAVEVKALCKTTDSLSSFTSWQDDFTASDSAPNHAPAAEKLWHGICWKVARHRRYVVRFNKRHFIEIANLFLEKNKLASSFFVIMRVLN